VETLPIDQKEVGQEVLAVVVLPVMMVISLEVRVAGIVLIVGIVMGV